MELALHVGSMRHLLWLPTMHTWALSAAPSPARLRRARGPRTQHPQLKRPRDGLAKLRRLGFAQHHRQQGAESCEPRQSMRHRSKHYHTPRGPVHARARGAAWAHNTLLGLTPSFDTRQRGRVLWSMHHRAKRSHTPRGPARAEAGPATAVLLGLTTRYLGSCGPWQRRRALWSTPRRSKRYHAPHGPASAEAMSATDMLLGITTRCLGSRRAAWAHDAPLGPDTDTQRSPRCFQRRRGKGAGRTPQTFAWRPPDLQKTCHTCTGASLDLNSGRALVWSFNCASTRTVMAPSAHERKGGLDKDHSAPEFLPALPVFFSHQWTPLLHPEKGGPA